LSLLRQQGPKLFQEFFAIDEGIPSVTIINYGGVLVQIDMP